MENWKGCSNCGKRKCAAGMAIRFPNDDSPCDYDWEPLPCVYCGGPLSSIREHNGRKYRHCYACHFEFYLE